MDGTNVPAETRTNRRRWVTAVALTVVVVGVFVTIKVIGAVNRSNRANEARSPSVSVDGWSAVALNCGAGSPIDQRFIGQQFQVHIVDLGDSEAVSDELVGCSEIAAGASAVTHRYRDITVVPDDDHRYFIVPTYGDRINARLAALEMSDGGSVRLRVQVLVPGPTCAVTDEYRGSLVLLVTAPAGAEVPSVTIDKVPEPC